MKINASAERARAKAFLARSALPPGVKILVDDHCGVMGTPTGAVFLDAVIMIEPSAGHPEGDGGDAEE